MGAETGDLEMFSAPAAKESDEMSDEQFRDQMAATQQAIKQLQQEEGQVRASDTSLAQIIVQFLGQSGNTDLFLLISRVVGQNIPSELILAIIALVDVSASKEVASLLLAPGFKKVEASQTVMTVATPNNFHSLSLDQKKALDIWIKSINAVSSNRPHITLDALIIKKRSLNPADNGKLIKEISPEVIQLSTFILRNYLNSQNVAFEFDQLHEFMTSIFVNLVKTISNIVEGQKKIT